ncbi:MAG: hypothetical protein ACREFT_18360, partial [Acetobacteraceae bacterium]
SKLLSSGAMTSVHHDLRWSAPRFDPGSYWPARPLSHFSGRQAQADDGDADILDAPESPDQDGPVGPGDKPDGVRNGCCVAHSVLAPIRFWKD